jgi:hypothetical protein
MYTYDNVYIQVIYTDLYIRIIYVHIDYMCVYVYMSVAQKHEETMFSIV